MPFFSLSKNDTSDQPYWLQWIGMGCASTIIAIMFFWSRMSDILACALLVAAVACYLRGAMLSRTAAETQS